jgi:hypothetical protein
MVVNPARSGTIRELGEKAKETQILQTLKRTARNVSRGTKKDILHPP